MAAKGTCCLATREGGGRTPTEPLTTTTATWDQIRRRTAREEGDRAQIHRRVAREEGGRAQTHRRAAREEDGRAILPYLYDKETVREDAILRWVQEKENTDGSDKVFVKQSAAFIQPSRPRPLHQAAFTCLSPAAAPSCRPRYQGTTCLPCRVSPIDVDESIPLPLSLPLQLPPPPRSTHLTTAEASEVVKALYREPDLALAFFRLAADSLPGFRRDAFSYNRILALLFRTKADPAEALRLIEEMERDGVADNISTINLLVGMGGGGVEVARCLEMANKWGLRLSGYTYKCIVQAHLRSREMSKGFEVYDEMRRKSYTLDIFAYNMLLDALARAGMVDQAYQVFEDMKQKHCVSDAYTNTILIRMSGKAGKTSKFLTF
ncbi:hypothetical protein GUJ93_ZPchr0006g41489 [Zizania palustris]|uniref:Pentacotripeptide-repeat region of PRORP domain-containing protein n=1 Tax=Zizania palustris TaxID=103762 RepID=A0A8J5SWI3_ZIZPA|nr:hypothetical protein GUJ93_ZPchr0006g41489 [Zizania palustris]